MLKSEDNMHIAFESCELLEEDCNQEWRGLFTLRPNVLFDVWTPLLFGILGTSIHVHNLRFCFFFEWLLPRSYVQYAFFMLTTALIADFGYCGKAGVIVGAVSVVSFVLCIIVRLTGESAIKVLQTKW